MNRALEPVVSAVASQAYTGCNKMAMPGFQKSGLQHFQEWYN